MKKIITRFVATVLAIALLAGINPAVSYATGKDNYQYKTLKTGKYYTPEESYEVYYKSPKHWEYTVYTLTLKENCVINITKTETTSYAHINIYKDKKCTKKYRDSFALGDNMKYADIYMPKGTYYFTFKYISYATPEQLPKLKFTSFPMSRNKKNNSWKKALSLSSDKWMEVAQTEKKFDQYWFKIKLKKDQKVRIKATTDGCLSHISLKKVSDDNRNYRGIRGNINRNRSYYCSEEKLKKGTYYICVSRWFASLHPTDLHKYTFGARYFKFKWY